MKSFQDDYAPTRFIQYLLNNVWFTVEDRY